METKHVLKLSHGQNRYKHIERGIYRKWLDVVKEESRCYGMVRYLCRDINIPYQIISSKF